MKSAMHRKMMAMKGGEESAEHPEKTIDAAIAALDHDDVPHEMRMHAAPILLSVKHFIIPGHGVPDHVKKEYDIDAD